MRRVTESLEREIPDAPPRPGEWTSVLLGLTLVCAGSFGVLGLVYWLVLRR